MGCGLYLYGILPAVPLQQLELEGLDRQPVQARTIDDFTLLYSEAQQEKYLASRRNLLGHERVLEQVMEQGHRTLLPLQFGLVIQDWYTVEQQLLMPKEDSLKQLLTKLEGQREVGIKIFWEKENEIAAMMQENPSLQAERDRLQGKTLSMEEIIQVGQMIEVGMLERRDAVVQQFRQALNDLAIEVVENDVLTEAMIYNAAYLIPWETEAKFSEQVEGLDAQFNDRLRIRYNSFTAPFNFAQLA